MKGIYPLRRLKPLWLEDKVQVISDSKIIGVLKLINETTRACTIQLIYNYYGLEKGSYIMFYEHELKRVR